jgi:hypothetical protein
LPLPARLDAIGRDVMEQRRMVAKRRSCVRDRRCPGDQRGERFSLARHDRVGSRFEHWIDKLARIPSNVGPAFKPVPARNRLAGLVPSQLDIEDLVVCLVRSVAPPARKPNESCGACGAREMRIE